MSKALNTGLRHHAGKTSKNKGFGLKCDDAGWIDIVDVLSYPFFWAQNHIQETVPLWLVNRNRDKIINMDEAGGEGADEVKLKRDLVSHKTTAGAVTMIPNCFHVTSRNKTSCMGIFQCGILPGGGSGRMLTFFNSFAPWDERSWKLSKGTFIRGERAIKSSVLPEGRDPHGPV